MAAIDAAARDPRDLSRVQAHGGYDAWVGEQAGSADRALKLYAGRFHDLFNDIGEEVIMADVLASIEARIS